MPCLIKQAQGQGPQYPPPFKIDHWILLVNKESLSVFKAEALNNILEKHNDIAVCYAMKEEMKDVLERMDSEKARILCRVGIVQ